MGRPVKKSILDYLFIHPYDDSSRLITSQKGSRRYKCRSNGNDVFRLVPTTDLNLGQAYMLAYDSNGNTYFVIKLTAYHATLVQKEKVGVPAFQFASGSAVKWKKYYSAVTGSSVQIENDW